MNKNSKSTFKKIKKYACIALIFAIFLAASIILYSNSLTRNAKEYIAYKYGVTQSEITEVEEYKAHIETEFVLLEKFNIWVVLAKWVFNVYGKNFNVEYFQKHYVDDFQLEDLEIWCTEYLQDNVDSNISGIELYSDMIFHDNTYDIFSKRSRYYTVRSSKSLSYSDNKLWKQEDIGEFLNYQFDNYSKIGIFLKVNNLAKYNETGVNSEYENLVLELNSGFDSKNCTLIPILHNSPIQLRRTNRCQYLLYNKYATAISCKTNDDVICDFTLKKR